MTFLWILFGIIYVACWIYFGLATFRKGHYWMFWIGYFLALPVDHRCIHQPESTRRRHGIGATITSIPPTDEQMVEQLEAEQPMLVQTVSAITSDRTTLTLKDVLGPKETTTSAKTAQRGARVPRGR